MLNNLKKLIQSMPIGTGSHSGMPVLDRSSGLPIWISVLPQVEEALNKTLLAMLYIDLEGFKDVEALFGREACQKILMNTGNALREVDIHFYGHRPKIAACCLGGDDFLVFIEAPPDTPDFERNYYALRKQLEAVINQANPEIASQSKLKIHLGYSALTRAPIPIESQVYEAVKEAIFVAKSFSDAREHTQWQNMKQILRQESVKAVYQPIVSLKSGRILGYEALSRGPEGSELASPAVLFSLAERYKCLSALELLCHRKAISGSAQELGDNLLFINISPSILATGDYQKVLTEILLDNGINPKRVVLELTERDPIEDFSEFREALNVYRVAGYRIAIDDAGAGYSSLQAIAELQVEFVKIDCSLIRDIDQNPTKRALLETLVDFCAKVGSRIICEGIESVDELRVLIDLGCNYGQGYLLAKPGPLNAGINSQAARVLKSYTTKPSGNQHDTTARIGDFVMYLNSIAPETSVLNIIEIFNRKKTITGLAVCHNEKPLGLIMRDKLFNSLGTRYGYEILSRKQARDIMELEPLILPGQTPIEESAKLIAERIDQGLNDSLIITEHGRYIGIVSISKILNSMAQVQIEQAKDANPLTGLPGNRLITRRICDDLFLKYEFAVLYIDLDNFKAFNDYFGFEHGDRALLFLSSILREVVERLGMNTDLLGHIGGDDFIIITGLSRAETMAKEIISQFELRVKELYDPETLMQGFILTTDRKGKLVQVPIMTLSIAVVANLSVSPFPNHLALAEAAAEVKQAAKASLGSHYFFDRRKTWDQLPELHPSLFG